MESFNGKRIFVALETIENCSGKVFTTDLNRFTDNVVVLVVLFEMLLKYCLLRFRKLGTLISVTFIE